MDFPINEKAEGRVLVPWEQNKFANLTVDSSSQSKLISLSPVGSSVGTDCRPHLMT